MKGTNFILLLMVSGSIYGQQTSGFINANSMSAYMNSYGLLFNNSGNAGLLADMNLAGNTGVWLSATDNSGTLRVAAHNILGNVHDFWPGPMELQTGNSANYTLWDKVYPVSRDEIQYHKDHFKESSYVPSANIANWPGSAGAPYAQVLAPFVDYKVGNQVYEPESGDYPYMTSDQLIYSITNDNYGIHGYSNSPALGVELHTTVYAFDESDSFLRNSVLVRYAVHNRSGRDYNNFRLSAVTNFYIGNTRNEFIGTDVESQTLFALNDTMEATFQDQLVSLGCMAFNRRISSTMYFNNDTNTFNGKPTQGVHFYNLMQGKWKNGKPLSYGSDGIDGSGIASFVYPYNSDHSHGDTMWSEYGNDPGPRMGVLNCDSIGLKNGNAAVFDFVYFYVNEKFNNIKQINHFCLNLKQALNEKKLLGNNQVINTKKSKNLVFPNPATAGDKLNIKKNLDVAMDIKILDLNGKEIFKYYLPDSENSIILPVNLVNGLYFIEFKTLNTVERQLLNINSQTAH